MKRFFQGAAVWTAALSIMLLSTQSARADGSIGPVYYANGDAATAAAECASGEVCATISQTNGDQIKVLVGESGHCNSYVMTFMRMVGTQVAAVWASSTDRNPDSQGMMGSKCGNFRNTHLTVDSVIDMGVFQNTDGKVSILFFGGSTTPPATPAPATPNPAPAPSSTPH